MDRAQVWYQGWIVVRMGGPTSGNWGHRGRPGLRGGSLPRGGHRALFRGIDPDDQKRLIGLYRSYRDRLQEAKKVGQGVPDYSNPLSAEKWAEDNGIVRSANYQYLPAQMNTINKTMAELRALTTRPGLSGPSRLDTIRNRPEGEWNCEALVPSGMAIGNNMPIAGGKKQESEWMHTMYRFGNRAEGAVRHEFGHIFHDRNRKVFADLLSETIKAKGNWKVEWGVTSRGVDNWGECIAENFVLFSIGAVRDMAPRMLATFLELTHEQA